MKVETKLSLLAIVRGAIRPGLLSKNYDGLQNDLGWRSFSAKATILRAFDAEKLWQNFKPIAKEGDIVEAAFVARRSG